MVIAVFRSRPSSYGSGLNYDANDITPIIVNPANISSISGCSTAGPISPTVSTAESFNRANSIRSVASSGFGSTKLPLHQVPLIYDVQMLQFQKTENGNSNGRDILAELDSLRLELQVKDSRLKDMQDYMDNLVRFLISELFSRFLVLWNGVLMYLPLHFLH